VAALAGTTCCELRFVFDQGNEEWALEPERDGNGVIQCDGDMLSKS
jgi:hypothetical protein